MYHFWHVIYSGIMAACKSVISSVWAFPFFCSIFSATSSSEYTTLTSFTALSSAPALWAHASLTCFPKASLTLSFIFQLNKKNPTCFHSHSITQCGAWAVDVIKAFSVFAMGYSWARLHNDYFASKPIDVDQTPSSLSDSKKALPLRMPLLKVVAEHTLIRLFYIFTQIWRGVSLQTC